MKVASSGKEQDRLGDFVGLADMADGDQACEIIPGSLRLHAAAENLSSPSVSVTPTLIALARISYSIPMTGQSHSRCRRQTKAGSRYDNSRS